MKNIFKIFSLQNLKKNIKTTCKRFPVSIIILFLISALFFTTLHYNDNISEFYNKRIFIAILALIMIFIFSIWTYLASENTKKNKLQRNLFQIIVVVFWIIFYNIFSLDPNDFENFLFFFLSFTWIIAFLFFAPYLKNLFKKWIQQSIFYTYFYNISVVILISFIFAWVLFGLGAIGIAATDALFDLDIDEAKTYWNWAILSMSIIAPLFALSQIPDKKSFRDDHFNENAFFWFLIKFVAIPFIYLYFFILYAYTIKVLSNFWNWPKWEVSWLVIGFSIFGYITYSFSYIFEEKNKLIKNFRKIFPYAVIPQIFMLFYAIYLRIWQYDITVNRYFVVIFGLWLLIISLYFIFSKKKNLIVIPAILSLFIIIISIIPKYNIYSFPEERQLTRLENNLEKAKILQENKITPLKNYSDISEDLSKNIYSWIDYLCDFNNCKSIKELFPQIYSEILKEDKAQWKKNQKIQIENIKYFKNKKECKHSKYWYTIGFDCFDKKRLEILKKEKYTWPNKWEIIQWITEKIKVKKYFLNNESNRKFFKYSKDFSKNIFPLEIKWYSTIYRISKYNKWNKKSSYAEFNLNKEIIEITQDWKIISVINTKEISKKLLEEFWKNNKRNLNIKDLTFELEEWKYKLIFENISVKNPDFKENNDKKSIHIWWNVDWYLLIK